MKNLTIITSPKEYQKFLLNNKQEIEIQTSYKEAITRKIRTNTIIHETFKIEKKKQIMTKGINIIDKIELINTTIYNTPYI